MRGLTLRQRIFLTNALVIAVAGAVLVLWSDAEGVSFYLDAALILSMLAFISTLAAARFHGEGKVF